MTAPQVDPSLVDRLCDDALAEIRARYGDDLGGGRSWLPFHNASHTRDVLAAATRLGDILLSAGRITPREFALLRIAAAFHDHEQGLGPGANEAASADAAARAMEACGEVFTAEDCERVRGIILSTRVTVNQDGLTQLVDDSDTLALALADSDLAHLGSDRALYRSLVLSCEEQLRSGAWSPDAGEPDRDTTIASLDISERLLRNHHYHLPEARRLYAARQTACLGGGR